jgi:hypothetical protein
VKNDGDVGWHFGFSEVSERRAAGLMWLALLASQFAAAYANSTVGARRVLRYSELATMRRFATRTQIGP